MICALTSRVCRLGMDAWCSGGLPGISRALHALAALQCATQRRMVSALERRAEADQCHFLMLCPRIDSDRMRGNDTQPMPLRYK